MRRTRTAMVAAALLPGLASLGEAKTLYTPAVETRVESTASTTHRLCCDILYTGNGTASVTIGIRTRAGGVVQSFGPLSLDPQEGTSRCITAVAAYCEFEIQGSDRFYRASAVYDAAGEYRASVPAR